MIRVTMLSYIDANGYPLYNHRCDMMFRNMSYIDDLIDDYKHNWNSMGLRECVEIYPTMKIYKPKST